MSSHPTPGVVSKAKPISPAPYLHEDLVLIRATVPEIIERTWTNNMEEWAKRVPLPLYHAREKHLARTDFSSEGRLITWILVPKPNADVTEAYKQWALEKNTATTLVTTVSGGFDPLDTSEENLERILGAVETYERPGIVATIGNEELKDVSSMSVASVYAPSKYRNHGYGKLAMKLLWKEIENLGASFTFLYSDLGAQFYTNFGWTARKSTEIVIPPSLEIPNATASSAVPLEVVTDNNSDDNGKDSKSILKIITDRDTHLLRQTLRRMAQQDSSSTTVTTSDKKITTLVAVPPEIRCFQWLHARSWFNASEISQFKEPEYSIKNDLNYGVRVLGRDDQFVLWHHDFTDDNLFIIRWRIEEEGQLGSDHSNFNHDAIALAFVKAAQEEAKKWNLSKIVYWNGDASLAKLLGLKVENRGHSIPSLGLVNSKVDPQSVEWVMNEKYSW
ncbi:hypothetical protein BGZ46_001288 [Entomortierella lignicola]|nr:hypothetical protein BGZ46_001288 [Entomortierella lignicola]